MPRLLRSAATATFIVAVVLLLPFIAVAVIAGIPLFLLYRWLVRWRFLRVHRKPLLLVYSDSPNWKDYIEREWLPRWGDRAVVLNWSQREHWMKAGSVEARLFRIYAGDREFNPLAIVIRPGPVRPVIVRFLKPFRAYKAGAPQKLKKAEAEVQAALDRAARA